PRRRHDDDFDDRPRRRRRRAADEEGDATGGLIPYKNPKALIAYYVGVFSLIPCIGVILAVVAIVLGFIGLKYAKLHPTARGQAPSIVGFGPGPGVTRGHAGLAPPIALGLLKYRRHATHHRFLGVRSHPVGAGARRPGKAYRGVGFKPPRRHNPYPGRVQQWG